MLRRASPRGKCNSSGSHSPQVASCRARGSPLSGETVSLMMDTLGAWGRWLARSAGWSLPFQAERERAAEAGWAGWAGARRVTFQKAPPASSMALRYAKTGTFLTECAATMKELQNKVAIVTGASRGGGRGIAVVLGQAGATVYVTGRTTGLRSTDAPNEARQGTGRAHGRCETVEDTAELVTAAGGVGIPVRCDHTVDTEVKTLFDRIRHEQRRVDILVNNVWGGYELPLDFAPFWEAPLGQWDLMFTAGVRAQLVATRLAVQLMQQQSGGLVIHTTANMPLKYQGGLFYYFITSPSTRYLG